MIPEGLAPRNATGAAYYLRAARSVIPTGSHVARHQPNKCMPEQLPTRWLSGPTPWSN